MAPINSTATKYQSKNIQSLKQNLNKRVMEYKTMHNIKVNNKDSWEKIEIDLFAKSMGRHIPVSKAVNNCPSTKLPCKCSKWPDLASPFVYCTKSFKWLANAFSHNAPGLFKLSECRELQKFIRMYNKCTVMTIKKATDEQIRKDIVRTFPNNEYFELNNSGYFSMYKVLAAYSNLNEMMNEHIESKRLSMQDQDSSSEDKEDTPRFLPRSAFRKNRNKLLRNEVVDSFWELSFEDSTQYVQGMNFIVGILWYHLSPELAFCLFVKLMKDYDMEDNYTPGLSGFKAKSEKLNSLIQKHLPELHDFFESKMIFIEMFTVELIMGLWGSILPFDNLMRFYDYFFSYKWNYFYGFIITFLEEIQDALMAKDDPGEIIQLLKDYTFEFRVNHKSERVSIPWGLILTNALDWVHKNQITN